MPGNRGSSRGGGGGRGKFFRGKPNWVRKKYYGNKSQNTSQASPTPARSQSIQPQIISYFPGNQSPYQGWTLYFPEEAYSESSQTVVKVNAVEKFIQNNCSVFNFMDIEDQKSFPIDVKSLINDSLFNSTWTTFKQDLYEKPEHTINCLGLAMHQAVLAALYNEMKAQLGAEDEIPSVTLPVVRARVVNHEPIIQLKNLKSNYYGKLVSVCGTIIRVGNIKLLCTWLAFKCNICQTLQCVKQPEGIFSRPTKCMTSGCHSKTFIPLHSSPYTQTVNWQSVRLQEILDDDHREGGRVPRTVECELTEDLLDSCVPGDVLTVTGIVKIRNGEENIRKKTSSMYLMYIDIVSIVNNKNHSVAGSGKGFDIEFNIKDYYAIQEIHSQPNLFKLLVNSLCPTIYGHEIVKAGLLLALFGGSEHGDCRSDAHVLMVGDPGLGKSQMLQACANVAPRGVYVCGNTSTTTGLTVTLTREAGGNYVLEAGALVLGDKGCCCIDEFDKMPSQHQALLEAMEQQSISIAKAGVVCSLPARTSILAAANPIGGHYNHSKTVSENLHMGSALLSRFDLVFIILDQPNEQLDVMLSEHVMALHSDVKRKEVQSKESQSLLSLLPEGSKSTLKDKLKLYHHENLDILPPQLLRKYLIYARKYVKPQLTEPACKVLQQFYLELRRQRQEVDCTPITTRQLESLMRLAEARAKLELRETVVQSDAEEVIEIMKYSLVDTLSDGMGGLDFLRSQNGSGMSTKNQGKKFISALQHHANRQKRSTYTVNELKDVAQSSGIKVPDFYSFLSALNIQGFLLKKGANVYQLLTVDY